jgi:hypothetical protein
MKRSALVCTTGMVGFTVLASCANEPSPRTPSQRDDAFRARLARECGSTDVVDSCRDYVNRLAVRSMLCQKAAAPPSDCDEAIERTRIAHVRYDDLEREREDGLHAQKTIAREDAERVAVNKEARARRVEQAKRNLQEWLQKAKEECSGTLSADVCRLAPAGNCDPDDRSTGTTPYHCKTPPSGVTDEQREHCVSTCKDVIDEGLERRFTNALKECVDRFVQANGRGTVACDVGVSPSPDIAAEMLSARTDQCSKTCAAESPKALAEANERVRAETAAPALVLAYKRCMVVADSTALARKYQAYDSDLYADLLSRANAVCRGRNRCDWLEAYSAMACTYSP